MMLFKQLRGGMFHLPDQKRTWEELNSHFESALAWCLDNFGEGNFVPFDMRSRVNHPDAPRWEYRNAMRTIYFRDDKDATLFKLFWC